MRRVTHTINIVFAVLLLMACAQWAGAQVARSETSTRNFAVGVKFTPAVTVSKDFWTISGSATKTVAIRKITITSVSTAAGVNDLVLIKRSTANSGGTSTSPTVVPFDSNDTATAVVKAYTAVSTEGTAVGQVWTGRSLSAIAAATATSFPPDEVIIDYSQSQQPIVLRGVVQGLALQAGTALAAGTVLSITVEFTEY